MAGLVAFDNLLLQADTLSASGEAQFFDVQNVADWRTNNAWKAVAIGSNFIQADFSSSVGADCFGIFRHNFNDGSFNVGVQYFVNPDWIDVDYGLIVTPGVAGVIVGKFTGISANSWRLFITSATDIPLVGHWFLGQHVGFKSQKPPFSPARYHDRSIYKTQISESGQFLGRTHVSEGAQTSIGLDLLQPGEIETDFLAFLDHSKAYPFYYSWDYDNHPEEAAYCWTRNNTPIRVRYYKTPQFMRFNANLDARIK